MTPIRHVFFALFALFAAIPVGSAPIVASTDFVARYAAAPVSDADFPKEAMPLYAARLLAGIERAATLAAADHMLESALASKLDPFNFHAIVHAERVGGDRWPAPLRAKFRAYAARWDFTKPIGVSLNYELMRDGAGWIAAGVWPDLRDAVGNDAARIRTLCSTRLLKTLDSLVRQGATEYDAPLYYGTDFMALRLLVDFADEPVLRAAARRALESMLVQTAAHWHRGYAVTSAGRAKYWGSQQVSPDSPGATTAMAFMLFGGDRDAAVERVTQGFWLAYPSPWRDTLAPLRTWQAALPVPRSVRASIIIPSRKFFVRKQAWITSGYGLASQRTDGSGADNYLYKETRNATLRWVSPKPASTFVVFQENRRRPNEKIANAYAYGENPYSQTLQHEGTLLGLYDVPADYGFQRLVVPFTTRGAIITRLEHDGWVCAHGGSVLFAYRSLTRSTWLKPDTREGLDRYATANDAARGGWILETSPVAAFAAATPEAELAAFAAALTARTRFTTDLSVTPLRLQFTNLAGRQLDLTWKPPAAAYANECQVDGTPVDYTAFPPLAIQDANGRAFRLPPTNPTQTSTSASNP